MIKQPIYRPKPTDSRRGAAVAAFNLSLFKAWLERQPLPVQHFWRTVKVCSMESLFFEFEGLTIRMPKAKELLHCLYRAALVLVDEKDSADRTITAKSLAKVFGLTRGVYQRLVKEEKAWQARPRLAEESRTLRRRNWSITYSRPPYRHSMAWVLKRPDLIEIATKISRLV